ncbi:MAG: hypothetical protein DRR06_13045, partial [Gammaproteobacteria bacterium]
QTQTQTQTQTEARDRFHRGSIASIFGLRELNQVGSQPDLLATTLQGAVVVPIICSKPTLLN